MTASKWLRLAPAGLLGLLAIVGPWITPYPPRDSVGSSSQPPDGTHLLGTDPAGLDVFSQLLAAARQNVIIAIAVVLLTAFGGVAVGLLTGMNESAGGIRGLLARGLSRVIDFLQAVPAVVIGLVAVTFYGASMTTLIFAIAVVLVPIQIRLVRTEVLRVRYDAYLDAARVAGLSEFRLTLKHVLPNSSWPALENTSVIFGVSIILTAALGFLGVGLPPPTPEWGAMIARGATDAAVGRWWSATFPALALVGAVAAVALASSAVFTRRRV